MNYVSDWKVGTGKKRNERETSSYNIDILVTNECTYCRWPGNGYRTIASGSIVTSKGDGKKLILQVTEEKVKNSGVTLICHIGVKRL